MSQNKLSHIFCMSYWEMCLQMRKNIKVNLSLNHEIELLALSLSSLLWTVNRARALCLTCNLFSHIIRTVNFRAESVCAPHVGPPFFFMIPMRQLKCKRTSTYSHKRWCRGGKGLQSVGEFHAHHPSFPASKAWICVQENILFFLHSCVCMGMCAS